MAVNKEKKLGRLKAKSKIIKLSMLYGKSFDGKVGDMVHMYFIEGKTLAEIGKKYNLKPSSVEIAINKAIMEAIEYIREHTSNKELKELLYSSSKLIRIITNVRDEGMELLDKEIELRKKEMEWIAPEILEPKPKPKRSFWNWLKSIFFAV
jgi:hypothetical protein